MMLAKKAVLALAGPSMAQKRLPVLVYQTRSFSGFESSFRDRAAGKAQLKEFYKLTHPDFFGSAPENVRGANEASMQTLNAYL